MRTKQETEALKLTMELSKAQNQVDIYLNNETGEWVWAVSYQGYWLNAFTKKGRAIRFAETYKLRYRIL
jgi:hypothetical protein